MYCNPVFWKNKKVFVTGHTGFKGGWLTLWLHSMGAQVAGYALAPDAQGQRHSFFQATQLADLCQHEVGDIRNLEQLKAAVLRFQPEIVFHMAAQPLVRASYQNPVETYSTNVMGTVHLLEAVRHCPSVQTCVVITTDKCYENKEWSWGYREVDRLGGHDPYSNSKACTELAADSYYRSFIVPMKSTRPIGLATVRAGNVIGGGDFATDRLIPDLFRALENKTEMTIRYPHSTRPWQHVLIPLSGYLTLAEKLHTQPEKYSTPFNFGPFDSDCVSVQVLLQKMQQTWKQQLPVLIDAGPKLHEAKFLKLDISKAWDKLQWKPTWDINLTVEHTVAWYQQYLLGQQMQMREFSLEQIKKFSTLQV